MEQMENEKVVDVFGFVAKMRKQRNFMVQTQVSSETIKARKHCGALYAIC